MIRPGERVFVDTGGWVALAEMRDPLHDRARSQWERLLGAGARLVTSVPVIVETFTFLDRKGSRALALRWKAGLEAVPHLEILGCSAAELAAAWQYFDRKELAKLSLVDATSFLLMKRHGIRRVLAFDSHFAQAGFRYVDG